MTARRLCQRGHDLRVTRDKANRCRECIRKWHRENRWRYMDKQKQRMHELYIRDRDRILARNKAWKDANRRRLTAVARLRKLQMKESPSDGEIRQMIEIAQKYPRRQTATV